jgi:CRISPR system Cascade subunit CasA
VTTAAHAVEDVPRLSLLDEALIRYRRPGDRQTVHATLPEVFVALAADDVSDFPALRPHQRHPWHAFLCQLGAIALHSAGAAQPFESPAQWREALLALTPSHPDGAPWCLVTPVDRPALLQPPVPEGSTANWKSTYQAVDELDMLVTSKNHDLKGARMRLVEPEHWLFALLSLQTQQGFLGAGNWGIARMNGGFASRPGVGIAAVGAWGKRWRRDMNVLLTERARIAEQNGMSAEGGVALLWLPAWDGVSSLEFAGLDPLFIEVCRRVRLRFDGSEVAAVSTGTKAARIDAKALKGITGDAWTPVDLAEGKALTLGVRGFDYQLMAELLFGGKYAGGAAQSLNGVSSQDRMQLVARGIVRGKGKTEGFHERSVALSPKVRSLLSGGHRDQLARISSERVAAIAEMRKLLWNALLVLFNNGAQGKDAADGVKERASDFSRPFEQGEDGRFFADLACEVEASDASAARLDWLVGLAARADSVLRDAFAAGPRSAMQRYRAQSAALSRFHGALRGDKSPLPQLAQHLRRQLSPVQEHAPS